ncbi:hypothetical protein F4779DRAFT_399868 [Xylariaceae sp. FL0662B]|nr:hypothetical protein F4779DRAFT_399868 [Xylariaceae sp. FL0662B]
MTSVAFSSRRSACDRCRGQKLRCLREQPDQERCDRCLRADAQCLTTPTFIMRSRSGDDLAAATRKRQRREKQPTPSDPYACIGTSISPSTGPAMPTSSIATLADLSQAWDPSAYNVELGGNFDDMLSSLDYASVADTQTRPSFNSNQEDPSHAIPPIHQFDIPSASSGETPSRQDTDRNGRETMGIALGDAIRSQNQSSRPRDATFAESCTHRLSDININLVTQLSRISQGPPTVTLDMLISRTDESDLSTTSPVDDILNGTRGFIDILEVLTQRSRSVASSSSSGDGIYGFEGPLATETPERHMENSSNHGARSFSPTPASLFSSSSSSSGQMASSEPNVASDVTTLLLILSCYVHVLRLYVVLFTHIHQFLQEIADSDEPTLCAIPDLGFGNFPLQSGNLQATMFIQISTSLFERIESLLGLPHELRVTIRGGKREGLLSEEDFTEVIKAVLSRDESGRPENGKGGVKLLRKNMKKAMQLLRESIAP